MKLKKINAVFALLTSIALFIHIGYSSFAYLTMYYNKTLKMITSVPLFLCVLVHGVCGMCAVFLLNDGTRLDIYKEQNRKTIIQRISAALIFTLLFVHLRTFELLKTAAADEKWVLFVMLIIIQICFYLVVLVHTALSLSKALITLGLIQERDKLRTFDKTISVICTAVFLLVSFAVVRGELIMFIPK